MTRLCKYPNCSNILSDVGNYCNFHIPPVIPPNPAIENGKRKSDYRSMSEIYPKYYKPVGDLKEIDVYAVHHLFAIDDPSGIIQHASKKLLLSGVRTGGKTKYQDIKEARDTLNRWLELNPEIKDKATQNIIRANNDTLKHFDNVLNR